MRLLEPRNIITNLRHAADIDFACDWEHCWDEIDFAYVLSSQGTAGRLFYYGETPVGFVVFEMQQDTLSVVRLAVHPDCRRSGFGMEIVRYLKRRCIISDTRQRLVIDVRRNNYDACKFLAACGLRGELDDNCWIFSGYYGDTPLDDMPDNAIAECARRVKRTKG